ncbi:asparagine synthase (glutamine-hydrolyzing) [Poriferisphaera sp. WC338]|uniref:asparagine synthase (glutamine-hydrolyzing) n=1 Tax=Poriferisphaera sp. WC338 TaxID=3425129 RepID=UPI003D814CCE
MCGFVGITWRNQELIANMSSLLQHRGPDDVGSYVDNHISLGHRRLSVIDLRAHGRQPMSSIDDDIVVAYNGEIYNFRELREKLTALGHQFQTSTDTEVIIHSYREYGPDLLTHLNGMFAFCIYDRRDQSFFIARDRIGIKPLYYSILQLDGQTHLAFASEMKALLACDQISRDINPQSLYQYIGYEFTSAPNTIFKHIQKLPPACYMTFKTGEQPKITTYWDMQMSPINLPLPEYETRLRESLEASVKRRLVSDVPVGVFLSGGLDSSTLVSMMHRCNKGEKIQTFSLFYEDQSFSELEYARHVAKQFGTDHHEIKIDPLSPETIERTVWHLDEPMTDLSAVPFFLLCEKVRQYITVCLSGEGCDELLCGYDRFKASKMHQYFRLIPSFLRKQFLSPIIDRLPDQPQKKGAINMLKRFIEGGNLPEAGEHMRWQYFSNPRLDRQLYQQQFLNDVDRNPFMPIERMLNGHQFPDRIAREIYLDTRYTMTSSLLRKVDKMSMAHGLEVRVPFLDHTFVEECSRIPSKYKLKGFTTKAIFRSAMAGILPDRIRTRGKQGYSLPIKNWLRGPLKDYMIETLSSSEIINTYFNTDYINTLIREHLDLKANHNHILWALINLAVWHKQLDFAGRPFNQPSLITPNIPTKAATAVNMA